MTPNLANVFRSLHRNMRTLQLLESELVSSRKAMPSESRLVRRCFDTNVYSKPCKVDDAASRCENSSRQGEMIDISSPLTNQGGN